jgi:hypothetical protein
MEQGEQQFVTGFNNGYLLAKHEPDLLTKLVKTLEPKNDYLSGFFSGKEEFELEVQKNQLNELGNIRNKSKDRNLDLDK